MFDLDSAISTLTLRSTDGALLTALYRRALY